MECKEMISKIISVNNVNSSTSFDRLNFYRWEVTPICLQYSSTGHVEQCGNLPVKMFFPKGIRSRLMSIHFCLGTFCSSCNMVCLGEADGIKPHRFVTLCTCTSTLIAACLCAPPSAKLAHLGPAPFNAISFSKSAGSSPLNWWMAALETRMMV